MTDEQTSAVIIDHPTKKNNAASSTEKIWGRSVYGYGYVGVPSILIQAQRRLKISPTQMSIIVHLLDYWYDPTRKPFPSKRDLSKRIGVTLKTIQNNISQLEAAGYVQREQRKTAAGDWNSNIYHLDGLIAAVKELEPEFTAERKKRKADREALVTPEHLRSSA